MKLLRRFYVGIVLKPNTIIFGNLCSSKIILYEHNTYYIKI